MIEYLRNQEINEKDKYFKQTLIKTILPGKDIKKKSREI